MTEFMLTRCVLRPLEPDDAVSMAREAANPRVWRNLTDRFPHPYTLTDAEAWIPTQAGVSPTRTFAIVVEGETVGSVGIEHGEDVHRRSMEIGYWLGEPYWNRGIATEALVAVTAYAFGTFDVNRIWAGCTRGIRPRRACWRRPGTCSRGGCAARSQRTVRRPTS